MADKVILNLPFAYEIGIIEPRHRKPDHYVLRDFAPVEIASLSDEEAPVGISLVRNDAYLEASEETKAKYLPDGPHRTEMRFYNGSLYLPVGGNGAEVSAEAFERGAADTALWRPRFFAETRNLPFAASCYPHQPALDSSWRYRDTNILGLPTLEDIAESFRPGKIRVPLEGNRRSQRELEVQQTIGDRLLVVDGGLWSQQGAHEPFWRVYLQKDKVEITLSWDSDPLWYAADFPLSDLDEARLWAEQAADRFNCKVIQTQDEAIIHVAEAVQRDPIALIARQAVSHWGAYHRIDWPEGTADMLSFVQGVAMRGAKSIAEREEAVAIMNTFDALDRAAGARQACEDDLVRVQDPLRRWREVELIRHPDLAGAGYQDPDADLLMGM